MASKDELEAALDRLIGSGTDIQSFKDLIKEHFELLGNLRRTKLDEVLARELTLIRASNELIQQLEFNNTRLKKEVNKWRKKNNLEEKYPFDI